MPEKIKIRERQEGQPLNACSGMVSEVIYLGSTTLHRVRTEGGEPRPTWTECWG